MLFFTCAVRVRLVDVPLERDEGEYAYAGQFILQGVLPYRLACNMKLPGTYAAYAAFMALFGQMPRGIHATAAAAGGAFAVLSLSQGVLGVFAHATHFVLLPALAGTLVLLGAIDSGRGLSWFASGLLFGTAFVMKQHGVVFVPFALAWLLLAWARVFKNFWFWTFDYAGAYVTQVPLSMGFQVLVEMVPLVAAATWPLWILAGVGLTAPLWDETARSRSRFATTFALFSFLAICPGLSFREHYFVLLLPAIAVLAAVALAAGARALARGLLEAQSQGHDRLATYILLPVFAAVLFYPVFRERALFFALPPAMVSRAAYGPNPFPEALAIAKRIEADTRPEDRVVVSARSRRSTSTRTGDRPPATSICTG